MTLNGQTDHVVPKALDRPHRCERARHLYARPDRFVRQDYFLSDGENRAVAGLVHRLPRKHDEPGATSEVFDTREPGAEVVLYRNDLDQFHAHCVPSQTKESLDAILDALGQYYDIHNRDWKSMHGAGFNYWSVLLIAKYK